MHHTKDAPLLNLSEDSVASWLVRSPPDQAVRVNSSTGQGNCAVFLGKTLNFHSAFLHPGGQMGTGELLGVTLRWTSIPSRGS